jgi:DNA-binding GntR family transcriptional regulator
MPDAPPEDDLRINRHTLHGELVERLRDMIIEGKLLPAARVNESQLGLRLGVSRTPLREAIKTLASEGLIELVPGRGAIIKKLTPRDVQEMLEVQEVLEIAAARTACRMASDAEIAGLRALHDQMMAFYAVRNRLEYFKCNQEFHAGLARLSGNSFLLAQYEAIQFRLKRIRYLGTAAPDRWQGAVEEHEAMISALERHDAETLARAVTRHLDQTWLRVRDSI